MLLDYLRLRLTHKQKHCCVSHHPGLQYTPPGLPKPSTRVEEYHPPPCIQPCHLQEMSWWWRRNSNHTRPPMVPAMSPSTTSEQSRTGAPRSTQARRRVPRIIYSTLVVGLGLGGLVALMLVSYWARHEYEAIVHPTSSRYPSWFTYKAGIRTLNLLATLQEKLTPPDLQALQLGLNFYSSVLVYHLATMGCFDAFPPYRIHQRRVAPCLRSEEINLNAPTAMHLPYFKRLLRAATPLHLLDYHEAMDCYTLTPLGARFQSSGSVHAMAVWHDGFSMKAFYDGLHTALMTGDVPFHAAHNATFWTHLSQDPARRRLFDNYMSHLTSRFVEPLADAFEMSMDSSASSSHHTAHRSNDLLRYPSMGKYVCDVGGGSTTSPLLTAILMRYPGAQGVVFDLPEATYAHDSLLQEKWDRDGERGQEGHMTSEADAHQRIKRVSGSFLTEGEMAFKLGGGRGCDVIVMKNILHDWGDAECLLILHNVRDAMLAADRAAGLVRNRRLVVYESLVGAGPVDNTPRTLVDDEDFNNFQCSGGNGRIFSLPAWITGGLRQKNRNNPLYDKLTSVLDLTMLAMLGEAKERTEGEFRALFAEAGFRLVKIVPTKTPLALLLLELAT